MRVRVRIRVFACSRLCLRGGHLLDDDSRPLTLSSNDGMTRAQALQVATEPSQSFFKFLLEPDAAVRAGSLEQLVRLLRDSIQGLGGAGKQQQEPSSSSPSSEADHQAPQHDQAHHDAEARGNGDAPLSSAASPSATANGVDESNRAALILAHLPWVVRLAHACPFDDVRAAFSALINEINDMVRVRSACHEAPLAVQSKPSLTHMYYRNYPTSLCRPREGHRLSFRPRSLCLSRVARTFDICSQTECSIAASASSSSPSH